jgi:PAS domain S-box-containing protein
VIVVIFLLWGRLKSKKVYNELERKINERNLKLEAINKNLEKEISDRKRAEKYLMYSEEQYRLLVENSNEGIIVVQDGEIIFYNERTLQVLHCSPSELSIENIINNIYPDDKETVIKINQISDIQENFSNQYTVRLLRNHSKIIFIEINATRVMWSGKPSILYFISDITNSKRAENEIKKALEKEKELSELRSRFISMTSHEFRTPLTSINTSAELLEKYWDKMDDGKKKNSLMRIQENVDVMTNMLNDVLTIGKSDAGMLHIKLEPVNIGELCREILREFKTCLVSKSNHNIKFEMKSLNSRILLDYQLVKQMLENLLSNAVKYSNDNSLINFKVSFSEKFIIFNIKDEGIGIPETDINNLFSPFFRANNTGNISGTGLGLAIVKRIVDLHNGKIYVKSEEGKGTEFVITLPLIKVI